MEYSASVNSFRRKLEKIERRKISYDEAKRGYESDAVRKAVINKKVPLKDALSIYDECNRKVSSGEWVELFKETPRYSHSSFMPDSASIVRYWGPKALLGESSSKIERLYKRGVIGKTHEVLRGTDEYRQLFEKVEGKWQRKKQKGRISEAKTPRSRILHRHWELSEMYRINKK